MHIPLPQQLLLLSAYSSFALAQGGAGSDPYIPVYTECPKDLEIRSAKDVGLIRALIQAKLIFLGLV